jgi:hypothetical protein
VNAVTHAQPRAGDNARVAGELARARADARAAERSAEGSAERAGADVRPALATQEASVQQSDQGGAHATTIQHDGKTTTISTDENGVTKIIENGKVTTVIDPHTIAQQAAQAATSAIAATPPPAFPRSGDEVPDSVIRLVTIVLSILAIIIIGFPLSRAFGRRLDRKAAAPNADPDVARRLDRIEQAIETMAVEVERVSEAQRYSARLLTERLPEIPARAVAAADQIR